MKKFKKFMAFAMAAALAFTPVATASAETLKGDADITKVEEASGEASGDGKVEGYVDTDVFRVLLPTSVDSSTFEFIMDPQGLINKTEHAAYTGTFNDSTVFFQTDTENYTNTSAPIKVTNKGTVAVDLAVEAKIAGLASGDAAITMAASGDFASGDATPSLYLALQANDEEIQNASGDVLQVLTEDGATFKAELAAGGADNYTYTWDTIDNKYVYDLKSTADESLFSSYAFELTGACNQYADWSDVTTVAPTVELTWTLSEHSDVPTSNGTTDIVINYTGAKPANGSIVLTKPDGSTWTPGTTKYSDGSITVTSSSVAINASWLKSAGGVGTWKATISGTDYAFIISQ